MQIKHALQKNVYINSSTVTGMPNMFDITNERMTLYSEIHTIIFDFCK